MAAAKKNEVSASTSKIDYEALDKELASKVQNNFQIKLENEFDSNINSFRRLVLENVKNSNYKGAEQIIDAFVQTRSEYPSFDSRVQAIIIHAKELVVAIETKRNFPNMHLLTMTKQKEILDQVLRHFNELKNTLKTIERIANDEIVSDLRSTHWLVRTMAYTILGITGLYFISRFHADIGEPFFRISEQATNQVVNSLLDLLGL